MAEGVFVVAKPHCQRRAIVDLLGESRSGGVASMRLLLSKGKGRGEDAGDPGNDGKADREHLPDAVPPIRL